MDNQHAANRWMLILVAMGALACVRCGSTTGDSVDAPVAIDAPVTVDVDPAMPDSMGPMSTSAAQFQTSGGGSASSANFRVELRMGAPQPMGAASSANFKAVVGPQ